MKKEIKTLIACVRNVICAEQSEIPKLTEQEQKMLYQIASGQDLAHLVSVAIRKKHNIEWTDQYKMKFLQQEHMAVYRYTNQEHALREIGEIFRENKICYLPLKGSVLRQSYPEAWMRTSSDIDILVREQDFEKAKKLLTHQCRFSCSSENRKDAGFYRDRCVHLELHRNLIKDDAIPEFCPEYIWKRVQCEQFLCKMPDEDFYAYHLEHMKNHFLTGGCGIRFFLDLWILNHRMEQVDRLARKEKLEQCGLAAFEEAAVHLAEVWFGQEKHIPLTKQMETYILKAGVYGSIENWALVQEVKQNGKWKRVWKRLWLPYDQLCWDYPNLKGKRYLQPYYEGKRFAKMIADGRWHRSWRELNADSGIDGKEKAGIKQMLRELQI